MDCMRLRHKVHYTIETLTRGDRGELSRVDLGHGGSLGRDGLTSGDAYERGLSAPRGSRSQWLPAASVNSMLTTYSATPREPAS